MPVDSKGMPRHPQPSQAHSNAHIHPSLRLAAVNNRHASTIKETAVLVHLHNFKHMQASQHYHRLQ